MAYPTPPTEPITEIATDATYNAPGDDWDVMPTKVAPTGAIETQGYVPGDPRPADVDNWLFNSFAKWLQYLSDFVDELKLQKVQGPASISDNEVPRFDGTDGKVVQGSGVIIADTTKNVSGVGTVTYGTVKTHTISISNLLLQPEDPATALGRDAKGTTTTVQANSAILGASIGEALTDRCTIKSFGFVINPGAARSGTDRMNLELWRTPNGSAAVQVGSTVYDDTTGSTQTRTSGTVTEAIDRSTNTYHLRVQVGNTAGAAPDAIIALFVTVEEAGPGIGT